MKEIIVLQRSDGHLVHAFTDVSDVSEWMKANQTAYRFRGDGIWEAEHYTIKVCRCPISGIEQPL